MHPQNLVFNPATLERLVERTGATHVGAEMDPSHLFWQGIDPVAAIDSLGELVFHAAAKDTRINDACRVNGVLDDRFRRLRSDEPRVNIGGNHYVNEWPQNSSWDFVAVGRGHDLEFWTRSSPHCTGSTPTRRSTSNTRTSSSVRSRASRWRPALC